VLIIQIALGIVLAVVILYFLPEILKVLLPIFLFGLMAFAAVILYVFLDFGLAQAQLEPEVFSQLKIILKWFLVTILGLLVLFGSFHFIQFIVRSKLLTKGPHFLDKYQREGLIVIWAFLSVTSLGYLIITSDENPLSLIGSIMLMAIISTAIYLWYVWEKLSR
jgi:hypothetical protein